jgi:hypothetical protein
MTQLSPKEIIDVIAESITAVAALGAGFGVWCAYRQLLAANKATEAANKATEVANKATEISQYATANGWMLDLDKVFLDHPRLRRFFRNGETIDGKHDDYQEAVALAELVLDTTDFFLKHRFQLESKIQQSWVSWVKDSFDNGPILRETFKSQQAWYNPEDSALGKLVKEGLRPEWLN